MQFSAVKCLLCSGKQTYLTIAVDKGWQANLTLNQTIISSRRSPTCAIRPNVLVDFFLDLRSHRHAVSANANIVTPLNHSFWRPLVTS